MATKRECIARAALAYGAKNFAERIINRAEATNFVGYDEMIKDGEALFLKDLEEQQKVANITLKTKALHLLWDHGWTEAEIAAALSVPEEKIKEWKDKRMKEWEGETG